MQFAESAKLQEPFTVSEMRSSGARSLDESVLDTRRAFSDAEGTRVLALAWAETGREPYARAAVDRLLNWADTYAPTGHPIDETRLEGLVMAYPWVRDEMTLKERRRVLRWFRAMRDAKESWAFGTVSAVNNHRTHQLKMLRLLDEVLGAPERERQARDHEVMGHLEKNLDASSGSSVDYRERDALYYHVYTLEPWLEIAWLHGTVDPAIEAAVGYLIERLEADDLGGEFERSTSPLDEARARAGFGYGRGGSEFDPRRARRVLWTYEALTGRPLSEPVSEKIAGPPEPHELFYWLRREQCLSRR